MLKIMMTYGIGPVLVALENNIRIQPITAHMIQVYLKK